MTSLWVNVEVKLSLLFVGSDIWRGVASFMLQLLYFQVKKSLDPFCWRSDGFQNRSGFSTSIHC